MKLEITKARAIQLWNETANHYMEQAARMTAFGGVALALGIPSYLNEYPIDNNDCKTAAELLRQWASALEGLNS